MYLLENVQGLTLWIEYRTGIGYLARLAWHQGGTLLLDGVTSAGPYGDAFAPGSKLELPDGRVIEFKETSVRVTGGAATTPPPGLPTPVPAPIPLPPPTLEDRVVTLERRVTTLEAKVSL